LHSLVATILIRAVVYCTTFLVIFLAIFVALLIIIIIILLTWLQQVPHNRAHECGGEEQDERLTFVGHEGEKR
jgi:fatty acid desaturase